MNNHKYTIENIKSKAKKLKKQLKISHNKALEIVSKELGYSSWFHCLKVLNQNKTDASSCPENKVELTFNDWLRRHKNRDSPLGDLSQEMLKDKTWPEYNSLDEYKEYFLTQSFRIGATRTLEEAWKTYKRYLYRQKYSVIMKGISKTKNSAAPNIPKITYIKDVKPLHMSMRTVEKFKVGDLAWISFDGRKAIPVTVLGADERSYSVRHERPLGKAGGSSSYFLDEVRSTAELACQNRITG